MASQRQLDANRANASKSTGPKTDDGKATVSRNATKHGLLSKVTLLSDEDQEVFRTLREGIYDTLGPQGTVEELLVERITSCAWRLRRIIGIEGVLITHTSRDLFGQKEPFATFLMHGGSFTALSRYETSLERSLFKALHELQRLQARRNGQEVPLPAAIDINFQSDEGAA